MDRVFLDANVLLAAVWRPASGSASLIRDPGIETITSAYAVDEATKSLPRARVARLRQVLDHVVIYEDPPPVELPPGIELPSADRPILAGAIGCQATHLLTSDKNHFGRYYGQTVGGVTILPPGQYRSRDLL